MAIGITPACGQSIAIAAPMYYSQTPHQPSASHRALSVYIMHTHCIVLRCTKSASCMHHGTRFFCKRPAARHRHAAGAARAVAVLLQTGSGVLSHHLQGTNCN